jgi:class 3 adenylate cyclase
MKHKLPIHKLILSKGQLPRNFISIKSKYLFMLLSIAGLCILVIGYTGWFNAQHALTESNYNQLTSIRAARVQQIESYFKNKEAHLRVLSENRMFIQALEEFSSAFQLLTHYQQAPNEQQLGELKSFYAKQFYPKLKANVKNPKALQNFYPMLDTVKYLQYHYIVANPTAIGEKHLLNKAKDQSYYSEIHARFHPAFRLLVEQMGLYDLFLIDKKQGHILYSVFKELDFATHLLKGPYAQSSLAKAVRNIMDSPDRRRVTIQDFKHYGPSYGAPAAFMAVPVYNRQNYVGILAIQLPIDQINRLMTRDKHWLEDGLGESGEVYLVGSDLMMRSDSRFLIEDAKGYLEALTQAKVDKELLHRIETLNTSILNQPVKTESAYLALESKTGHKIVTDYRGVDVLSAYAPLNINNLRWIILAEKDLAEVNQTITDFQYALMTVTIILILITGVLSLIFASRFLKPIDDIIQVTSQFLAGHKSDRLKLDRSDEMGTLGQSINQLMTHSQQQQAQIEEQAQDHHKLMLNFLPSSVVEKLEAGEQNIAHKHANVAIMFTSIYGFDAIVNENQDAQIAIEKCNQLFQSFDRLAEQYDIEKLTIVGDSYIAACGLNKPRLDYASRCVDFAQQLFEVVALFNQQEGLELKLRIGICAGEVIAGIIGNQRYVYSLWGDTVAIASRIRYDANLNGLRISQSAYNKLTITEGFEKCELMSLSGFGHLGTWEYQYRR